MRIFGEKKSKIKITPMVKNSDENASIIERPRICCIDLNDTAIEALRKTGANISQGSLGSKIKVPTISNGGYLSLLLNYDFPKNLHEFDIVIIDLDNYKTIDFKAEDHKKEIHTGRKFTKLLCSYPETLFDPRPMATSVLKLELDKISNRQYLAIVFSSEAYQIEYQPVIITEGNSFTQDVEKHNIYGFWDYIPTSDMKYGKEINTSETSNDLQILLEKYTKGSTYNQTFYHPEVWNTNRVREKDENFFPLLTNMNDDIVSYVSSNENRSILVLPQIADKPNFIVEFLTKVAPSIFPDLFPFSTAFNWKTQEEYWLPKHAILHKAKVKVEEEFKKKIEDADKEINDNIIEHSFLFEMLSETGDILTNSLIKYFRWLGFDNVSHHDETATSSILEEDIQIQLSDGIIIIECKGIGGTSTDGDCSQISKIKHRRCRQRGNFDVYALYIVNHQRYLPPLKRQLPPFSDHQIQDAVNDERGLLTTWQLFNSYFEIEKGIITKEEARQRILDYGLINLKPKGLVFISESTEILKEGRVCIINIDNTTLRINDELLIEKNDKFEKVKIIEIQQDDKSLQEVSIGNVGIKLSAKIPKKSKIWKKELS